MEFWGNGVLGGGDVASALLRLAEVGALSLFLQIEDGQTTDTN